MQKVYATLKEFDFVQGEYNSREDRIVPCPDKTIKERAEELQHDSPFIKIDRVAGVPLIFQIEVHTRLETIFDNTLMKTGKPCIGQDQIQDSWWIYESIGQMKICLFIYAIITNWPSHNPYKMYIN